MPRGKNRHPESDFPLSAPPASILIVMLSAVGDAVQVLPVVTALKRAFPGTQLTWVIQPNPHTLVADHPGVDEFILFNRDRRGPSPRALWSSLATLRSSSRALRGVAHQQPTKEFDLILGLQTYLKAGLLTALAPGRIKIGFDWGRSRDLNALFTTHRIPAHPDGNAHTQDQYFEFLHLLGVDPDPLAYGLTLTREEREAQQRFFQELHRPGCAVVLASSDPRKDWSIDGYARVLETLYHDFGLQPLIVGGSSDREARLASELTDLTRAPVVSAMANDLRRLLWLLDGSRLVLSPDTGPLHMARAMEVPVVGLYGLTNPRRSGPYRKFQELVVDGYARYPGEEYEILRRRRRGGMGRITPRMVLEKMELALELY